VVSPDGSTVLQTECMTIIGKPPPTAWSGAVTPGAPGPARGAWTMEPQMAAGSWRRHAGSVTPQVVHVF